MNNTLTATAETAPERQSTGAVCIVDPPGGHAGPHDPVVLAVRGDLDVAAEPGARAIVDDLLAAGRVRIIFDLSASAFMDTSGLDVLCHAYHQTTERGGYTRLAGVGRQPAGLLRLSGQDRLFPLYRAVPDAIGGAHAYDMAVA